MNDRRGRVPRPVGKSDLDGRIFPHLPENVNEIYPIEG